MARKIATFHYQMIGKIFIILGMFLLILKACLPEHITSEGILQEPFFLLPIGFFFFFLGGAFLLGGFIFQKVKKHLK